MHFSEREGRERRSRHGRQRAHAAREITLGETSAGARRVEPGVNVFPVWLKSEMIYSRAQTDPFSPPSFLSRRRDTASSGTRFLFPSGGPRFRPRSSSRDWIYYLQFLDHSSAQRDPPLSPFSPRPFPPSCLRFRCTHRRTVDRSVIFTGRFGRQPSLLHDESFLHAFRFSSFRPTPSFALFSVPMFRDFSFIPVDRLVHDNEIVAQL